MGTNIVVVPFAALMDDLVDRARLAGIDCLRWKSSRLQDREQPVRAARLVVVSADVVEIDQFRNYLDSLRSRKLLKRIFFDEAHTAILDVAYRRRLEGLKGLHRNGCPVIALTATMPGVMERWFRQTMLMGAAEIIRASTVKCNIRYKRDPYRGGVVVSREEGGWQYRMRWSVWCCGWRRRCTVVRKGWCTAVPVPRVKHWQRSWGVISITVAWWKASGRRGGKRAAGAVAEVDRGRWWQSMDGGDDRLGDPGWISKGLWGWLHMEQPYGIVDFVQQTGRGGRCEGEVVESVVVMEAKKVRMDEKRSDVEHRNHQAMEWFVESHGCRRVVLGMFMDVGLADCGQDCEQLQVEACDRCRAKHQYVDGRGAEGRDEEELREKNKDGEVAAEERGGGGGGGGRGEE